MEDNVRHTDMIDGATFEVDGGYGDDGHGTRAFLILEGDFVQTFEDYLNDPEASSVVLRVSRDVAEKLVVDISRYL